MPQSDFDRILTEAVDDLVSHGYSSETQIDDWVRRLRQAARSSTRSESEAELQLRKGLSSLYQRLVEKGGLLRTHSGVSRFTLEKVRPHLRAELDRRLAAARSLIKLNREDAVDMMERRFRAWSTSVPKGGVRKAERRETKYDIRKSIGSLAFQERRVLIDQGLKFAGNLSHIFAVDGGAIAGEWHSRWKHDMPRPPLTYPLARRDHHNRDGKFYLIRGNWAQEQGLVKVGPEGYVDEQTLPGEEIFCSCSYSWIHALSKLPEELLTEKGKTALEEVRRRIA